MDKGNFKIVIITIMMMVLAAALSACGSSSSSRPAGVTGAIDIVELDAQDPGGGLADVEAEAVHLLAFQVQVSNASAVFLEAISATLTGTFDAAELADTRFYLVSHGANDTLETSKQLFAPTVGGDDETLDGPTAAVGGVVTFELDNPGERIGRGGTLDLSIFAEFNFTDTTPPDVDDEIFARISGAKASTTGGFSVDEDIAANVITGTGAVGTGISVVGRLQVTPGAYQDSTQITFVGASDLLDTELFFAINLAAKGEAINVTEISFPLTGDIFTDTEIDEANCDIGLDANGDGIVDAGFAGAVANIVGGILTFSGINEQVAVGFPEDWTVQIKLNDNTIIGGDDFTMTFDDDGDLLEADGTLDTDSIIATGDTSGEEVKGYIDGEDADTDFNEGNDDIIDSGTSTVQGTITSNIGAGVAAGQTVYPTEADVTVCHVTFTCTEESVNITQFGLKAGSTCTLAPDIATDVINVELWLDVDSNGTFEPLGGDILGQIAGVANDFTADAITFSNGATLGTAAVGTPAGFFVVLDFETTPTEGEIFQLQTDVASTLAAGVTSLQALTDAGVDTDEDAFTVVAALLVELGADGAGGDDDKDADTYVRAGDAGIMALDAKFTAYGGPCILEDVTLTGNYTDGFESADVNGNVLASLDTDDDGAIDNLNFDNQALDGLDPDKVDFDLTATLGAGTGLTITPGVSQSLVFKLTLAATPEGGEDFQFEIDADTDLVLAAGPSGVQKVILSVATPPTEQMHTVIGDVDFALSGSNPGAANIHNDNTALLTAAALTDGVPVLAFTMEARLEDANITSFRIKDDVGAAADLAADITSVDVYKDSGNGTYEQGGETLIGSGTYGGVEVFLDVLPNTSPLVLLEADGATLFWVVYKLANNGANAGNTFTCNVDPANFEGTGVSSGADYNTAAMFDFDGNYGDHVLLQTIITYLLVSDGTLNPADARATPQGTLNYPLHHVYLEPDNAGGMDLTQIIWSGVDAGGNEDALLDDKTTTAEAWHSATVDNAFDPGGDENAGGAAVWAVADPSTTTHTDFDLGGGAITLVAGTPIDLWLSADIDTGGAIPSASVLQAEISAICDVSISDGEVIFSGGLVPTGGDFIITGSFGQPTNNVSVTGAVDFDDATIAATNTENTIQAFDVVVPAGENINLSELVVTFTVDGTLATDVADIELWTNPGADGTIDGAEIPTTYVLAANVATITIDPVVLVTAGVPLPLLVAVELSGTGLGGETITCEITGMTGTGVTSLQTITSTASPAFAATASNTTQELQGTVIVDELDPLGAPLTQATKAYFDGTLQEVMAFGVHAGGTNDGAGAATSGENIQLPASAFVFDSIAPAAGNNIDAQNTGAGGDLIANGFRLWIEDGTTTGFQSTEDVEVGTGYDCDAAMGDIDVAATINPSANPEYLVAGTTTVFYLTGSLNGNADPTNNERLRVAIADVANDMSSLGVLSNNALTETSAGLPDNEVRITGSLDVSTVAQPGADTWAFDNLDVPVLAFQIAALGENFDDIDLRVDMAFTGAMVMGDITRAELWHDVNDDGLVDAGDDGPYANTGTDGNTFTWTDAGDGNEQVNAGGNKNFVVSLDLNVATGGAGDTFTASTAQGTAAQPGLAMDGLSSVNDVAADYTTTPISGNAQTIVGRLTLTQVDFLAANGQTKNDNSALQMMTIELSAVTENVTLNTLIFDDLGTADDAADITSVKLFKEVSGAGFDPLVDTTQMGDTGTYAIDGGVVVIANIDEVIVAGDPAITTYLVYELSDAAGNKNTTFQATLTAASKVTSTGVTTTKPSKVLLVSDDADPADTALLTDDDDGFVQIIYTHVTLSLAATNSPTARLIDPDSDGTTDAAAETQDYRASVMLLQFVVDNAGTADLDTLDVTFGSPAGDPNADIADVDLLEDDNDDADDFDIANDTNVFSETAADKPVPDGVTGIAQITFDDGGAPVTFAVGTTYLWMVVEFSGAAKPGDVFTCNIPDQTDLVANAGDQVIVDTFALLTGAQCTVDLMHREELPQAASANLENFQADGSPRAAVAGDFAQEGQSDLVVVDFGDATIDFVFGDGDGTFTDDDGSPWNDGKTSLHDIVAGDFDGDSDLDVMVTNRGSNSITLYELNNTDGNTHASPSQTDIPATNGSPWGICAGDFDHDGDIDAVVAQFGANSIQPIVNNNNTSWTIGTFVDVTAANFGPEKIVAGDFNEDGDLDVIVLNTITNSFVLMTGNGDLTFTAAVAGVTTANANVDFSAGDFDADGDLDIVTLYATGYEVFLGDGAGGFTTQVATAFSPALTAASAIACGDFDTDGDSDFAVGNGTGTNDRVYVYTSAGDGSFSATGQILELSIDDAEVQP
ncbi:FG-GAP-like repeat-containing protein, partial [Planctomycetota bacterium]